LAGPLAAFALLAFAWHVGFERSCWQGTPGKRALGLRVADAAGAPPAAWRSAWRFLAGSASWLTLNLGHALAAVPPGRAALHDRLSRTRVLARDAALPGWARGLGRRAEPGAGARARRGTAGLGARLAAAARTAAAGRERLAADGAGRGRAAGAAARAGGLLGLAVHAGAQTSSWSPRATGGD